MPDHAHPDRADGEPKHASEPAAAPVTGDPAHRAGRRRGRRVRTEPPAGSDPTPSPEPPRHASTENDEQLKRDKPPHWG